MAKVNTLQPARETREIAAERVFGGKSMWQREREQEAAGEIKNIIYFYTHKKLISLIWYKYVHFDSQPKIFLILKAFVV